MAAVDATVAQFRLMHIDPLEPVVGDLVFVCTNARANESVVTLDRLNSSLRTAGGAFPDAIQLLQRWVPTCVILNVHISSISLSNGGGTFSTRSFKTACVTNLPIKLRMPAGEPVPQLQVSSALFLMVKPNGCTILAGDISHEQRTYLDARGQARLAPLVPLGMVADDVGLLRDTLYVYLNIEEPRYT